MRNVECDESKSCEIYTVCDISELAVKLFEQMTSVHQSLAILCSTELFFSLIATLTQLCVF